VGDYGDGSLDFAQFLMVMASRISVCRAAREYIRREAFKSLDKDGDGFISLTDLRAYYRDEGIINVKAYLSHEYGTYSCIERQRPQALRC
jgi:Ca2+-binding EF-hand superfamily protein